MPGEAIRESRERTSAVRDSTGELGSTNSEIGSPKQIFFTFCYEVTDKDSVRVHFKQSPGRRRVFLQGGL